MRKVIGAMSAGAAALALLTGCPSDNCDNPGVKKMDTHGHQLVCKKKIGESNYHWHPVTK